MTMKSRTTSHTVACLDVYDGAVREVILRCAPEGWNIKLADSYEETHQKSLIANAQMILTGWASVPAWMFDGPNLQFVQKFGAGYDKIDLNAARAKGISVAIANGMNADPVSELVVLLVLGLYRKIRYLDETIRAGLWVKSEMRAKAHSLRDKKFGILGLGAIGKAVSKRVQAFGAKVIYHNPTPLGVEEEAKLNVRYCTFDELIATADILSLHLPLTPDTSGIIDTVQLSRMKPSVILINTARGGLVVESDLVQALKRGHLLGVGLDVFQNEPLSKDHALFGFDNVMLTPHIGGAVFDNVQNMALHCFNNMKRFAAGQPLPSGDVVVNGNRGSPGVEITQL
ncbi:2-hydroxyacid dehydrogenase [Advenella sp. FME57]|uniref:2-hydroxyacid dehydrogenase n=1 Tax=Advenella sp. FME57 TaxID=2742604 RepID=UPI0018670035|nr:2-hydroxyacid dehydrogenase [Advenella sp. FME57]